MLYTIKADQETVIADSSRQVPRERKTQRQPDHKVGLRPGQKTRQHPAQIPGDMRQQGDVGTGVEQDNDVRQAEDGIEEHESPSV